MSNKNKFEYRVTEEDKGLKIKNLLKLRYGLSTRLLNKLKTGDNVFLDGESVKMFVVPMPGQVIRVDLPAEKSEFAAEDIKIDVVYEDEDLLIINKQPGYVVHPTKGHPNHTIANGIMRYMETCNGQFKIRFANRLDMDTSGLLVVAKNSHAQNDFSKQMGANCVVKKYVAVLSGHLENDCGVVDLPIGKADEDKVNRQVRADGLASVTGYEVLERYTKIGLNSNGREVKTENTLVLLTLETGRTHQIRVHMAYLGCPVVGDVLYGEASPFLIERQALHAAYLAFCHPVTGKQIEVKAPLPEDMKVLIQKIKG